MHGSSWRWLLPRICLLCGDGAEEPYNLCTGCIRALPRIDVILPAMRVAADGQPIRKCALNASTHLASVSPRSNRIPLRGSLGHPDPAAQIPTGICRSRLPWDACSRNASPGKRKRTAWSASFQFPCTFAASACVVSTRAWRSREYWQRLLESRQNPSGWDARGTRRSSPELRASARAILNVRDAFTASRRLARFRRVAIVDDVVTTGATAAELARCILARGVESVDLWCVARAERSVTRIAQASRLATASALDSMKSRRGPT